MQYSQVVAFPRVRHTGMPSWQMASSPTIVRTSEGATPRGPHQVARAELAVLRLARLSKPYASTVCALAIAAILSLVPSCTSPSEAVDPDPHWQPDRHILDMFTRLMLERGSRQVDSRDPPFGLQSWRFAGLGKFHGDPEPGTCAYFMPTTSSPGHEDDLIVLAPRCIGDVGDVYRIITGQSHENLTGPTSAFYEASKKLAEEDQRR